MSCYGGLIQLGSHYEQPQYLAPPLPVAAPKAFEAYDLAPVPLPYIAAKPIVIQDAEDDEDSDEESAEYGHGSLVGLGHGHEGGGGSQYGEEHHAAHGEKGSKGYNSKGHFAKGQAGSYGKVHKEGHGSEASGEKGVYYDEADSHGKHHNLAKGYKGGNHGHKKHHSKGEDITGYHKVFEKDEFKKDHDFYDVADNSGHYNKHGSGNKYHSEKGGAHEEGEKGAAGYQKGEFGKSGHHSKGHSDDGEVGHISKEGDESHYDNHEEYGKKGEKEHEKEYEYEDIDEDEDEE
ncbi:keratin, type I cytoskeletal 9-like [Leptidea sinapis]|uniref:keratin, type I cytoskeletal 9-like n=1 Tax=Leptidea sinapis TaxID=189913 RepID=UPI0021C282CD|nr:keratin, type I cytoskeletal 9-like [Leptidea sinapis]